MFELLGIILFCWLFVKALGLAVRLAWGATKIAASVLFALAVPVLILCLVFAGGILLMIPIAMVGGALLLLKACF